MLHTIVIIKANRSNIYLIRSYWASSSNINTWAEAMQLCENMGRGLVKWETADSYLDLKHLSSQGAYWTALTNTNGEDCDGASACNGLLVMTKWKKPLKPKLLHKHFVHLALAANFWWPH